MAKRKLNAKQKAKKAAAAKARRDAKKATAAADPSTSGEDADTAEPENPKRSRRRLKSLDEFNTERRPLWSHPSPSDDKPNGIACPHCGEETLDRSPGKMLLGSPPRVEIHCNSECGFVGRRIA